MKKELLKRAKDSQATHVAFESDGTTAKAYWFDLVSTIGYSSFRSSYLAGCRGIPLPDSSGGPFSVTVHFVAFAALPTESFVCSVYEAGFLRLLADKDGVRITIRDQEIRRPFTTFASEKVNSEVAFLFHPEKLFAATDVSLPEITG